MGQGCPCAFWLCGHAPSALLQPKVHSLGLHPCSCPQQRNPQGLFRPLSPPCNEQEGGLWTSGGTGRGLAGGTALAAAGLFDMPVPLCSVQLAKDGSRAEQSLKYMQDPHAPV